MLLSELEMGSVVKILKINADNALRNRLSSLGIMKGELLTVKQISMTKSTIEVEIATTLIALRSEEADKIEVEELR